MYVLIYLGQIAGTSDTPDNLPSDFLAVHYNGGSIENLYWDGTNVLPIPEAPGDNYYWDVAINQWVEMLNPISYTLPTPLTRHELAPVLYEMLTKVDPVVAECLTYLLASTQGDNDNASQMLDLLTNRCTEYKRIQDEGTNQDK